MRKTRNLPFVICTQASQVTDPTASTACLAEYFTFFERRVLASRAGDVPQTLRRPDRQRRGGVRGGAAFIPTPRLVWEQYQPTNTVPIGGIPGEEIYRPLSDRRPRGLPRGTLAVARARQLGPDQPERSAEIVPATQPCLPTILMTTPSLPGFTQGGYVLPSLGARSPTDIGYISPH